MRGGWVVSESDGKSKVGALGSSTMIDLYLRPSGLALVLWLGSLVCLPCLCIAESSVLPVCQENVNRHVTEENAVFVRVPETFKDKAQAEEFILLLEKETGKSLHDGFCRFGLDVLPANTFTSILDAQFQYPARETTSFRYVEITLCVGEKKQAINLAKELEAEYQGYDDLSQCHYVGWGGALTHEEAKSKKAHLNEKGLQGYIQVFAADVWLILGKAMNAQELDQLKQFAKEMELEILVFRDTISGGD